MIRTAIFSDIDKVADSYTELLLYEQQHGAYTVWELGIYPTRETAEKAFSEKSLYVFEQNDEICASIIANHIQPEEYNDIDWKCSADPNEVLVIHLLCVRPSWSGRGVGKKLVQFIIDQAMQTKCKSVRLDTGAQNKPASGLYRKLGFELAGTKSMKIGGLIAHDDHLFFEKVIK